MNHKTYFVEFRDRRNRQVIVEEHATDEMSKIGAAIKVAEEQGWLATTQDGPRGPMPLFATKRGMPDCDVYVRGPFR